MSREFLEQFRSNLAAARYPEADRLLRLHLANLRTADEVLSMQKLVSWANLAVRAARAHDAAQLAGLDRTRKYLGTRPPASPNLDVLG